MGFLSFFFHAVAYVFNLLTLFWLLESSTDGKSKQAREPEEFSDSFRPSHDLETMTSFHEDYSYGRKVPRDFDSDDCSQRSSFFRRQLNVDHFDDESAELADYLSHFERVAKWNGWSHEEKGIHLALNLRGAAQQVLGYLTDFEDDYDVLCPVLKKRFCPVPMYRSEFRNRKKFKGESDFGFSLSRLVNRA